MGTSRDAHLDPAAILATIGVTEVTDIVAITGGEDTAIWRVKHQGRMSALRVMRADQTRSAVREAAAMRAAHAGGVPVPQIRREGVWEGQPVFLLEWLPGFTAAVVAAIRPWRAHALGIRLGQAQARIHSVTAPDTLRERPGGWLAFIEADEPALSAHLRALQPRMDALIHLDFHPLNVIVGDGRPFDPTRASIGGTHVMGVIDWTNATAGDPRADVAYTTTLLSLTRNFSGLPPRRERAAMHALLQGVQRGYRSIGGALGDLAPFYAWAGAYITRDVAHRLGQPGSVVTPAHLARLRRWTVTWKRRAGVP